MDEDIDIEEHDILENPLVKNIFPHIDHIKEEPLEYEDNYEEYNGGYRDYVENENMDLADDFGNYISESDSTSSRETELINRITLGKKPNYEAKLKYLQVTLEDWGPRLRNSPCFCKDCKTLFATRNALDAHNMAAHSFLVAMDNPKDNSPPQSHKYCNHCHKYFDDDNDLIQHLYDLITAKKNAKAAAKEVSEVKSAEAIKVEAKFNKIMACPICTYSFRHSNNMRLHLKSNHGSDIGHTPPVEFTLQCKFCHNFYSSKKYYNIHIQRVHTAMWSKKVVDVKKNNTIIVGNVKPDLVPAKTSSKDENSKFKCSKCKLIFNSLNLLKIHQRKVHINKVIVSKKPLPPRKYTNRINAIWSARSIVPKNVLFKCDRCPIHFMNCFSSLSHAGKFDSHSRDPMDSSWICHQCKRCFRPQDKEIHELQHKQNANFKVYIIHKNIYSRVLYKCLTCEVYFDERIYTKHKKSICDRSKPSHQCNVCKINISNQSVHTDKHVSKKFIKSDFILIDEYVSFEENWSPTKIMPIPKIEPSKMTVKRKLDNDKEDSELKRQKLNITNVILYYCKYCKTYMRDSNRVNFHVNRKCGTYRGKQHCYACGLMFCQGIGMHSHLTLHNTFKLRLEDFTICCVSTMKPIIPPMPEFPACPKCNMHYVSRSKHHCKERSKECPICKNKFNLASYGLHMLHHRLFDRKSNPANAETVDMSIKMKYDKLKSTWDVLYNCNTCDVICDSYDNVIEHCQKHYNNMENYDVTITACEICSLKYEKKSYEKHRKLHSNQDINRNSFTILNYDPSKLLTDEWIDIFKPLPIEQARQIFNQSIYVTRLVKMNLLVNGPPEFTIYKCEICRNYVSPKELVRHAKGFNQCVKTVYNFECVKCKITYSTMFGLDDHLASHAGNGMSINLYRIVAFNAYEDRVFNAKLFLESKITKDDHKLKPDTEEENEKLQITKRVKGPSVKTGILKKSHLNNKQLKYKYYQCQKCFSCRSTHPCKSEHVCVTAKTGRTCPKCKYVFPVQSLYRHHMKHENKNFIRSNIRIIPFNPKEAEPPKVAKIFKCSCGVHFPSMESIVNHCVKCSPDLEISCEDCSKCGFKFPTNLLFNHLVNHHSNGNQKVVVFDVPMLFRCTSCKCLFLKRMALSNHLRGCDGKSEGKKCSECSLIFHKSALASHMESHNLKVVRREKTDQIVLYKCNKCKTHAITQALGIIHINNNHTPSRSTNCKKCGLSFFAKQLKEHVHLHHTKNQCKRSDFKIVILTDDKVNDENESVQETNSEESNTRTADDRKDDKIEKDSNLKKSPSERAKSIIRNNEKDLEIIKLNEMELFRCIKCDLHYCNVSTFAKHVWNGHKLKQGSILCRHCNRKFTSRSLARHKSMHRTCKDIALPVKTGGFNLKTHTRKPLPYDWKLYKCGECKVHFMNQTTCYKHTLNHVPMNPNDYIACKLCNLQFRISSLNYHVTHHHSSEFNIEKVLIEEYSRFQDNSPKIDLYYGADKVQSKLVSTTTDDNESPNENRNMNTEKTNNVVGDSNVGKSNNDKEEKKIDSQTETDVQTSANKEQVETSTKETQITVSEKVVESTIIGKDETSVNVIEDTLKKETEIDTSTIVNKKDVETTNNIDNGNSVSVERESLSDGEKTLFNCSYCDETFKNNTSKEFHESLDHLDAKKDCPICNISLNASILNELHLETDNDSFICCICSGKFKIDELSNHSFLHKTLVKQSIT